MLKKKTWVCSEKLLAEACNNLVAKRWNYPLISSNSIHVIVNYKRNRLYIERQFFYRVSWPLSVDSGSCELEEDFIHVYVPTVKVVRTHLWLLVLQIDIRIMLFFFTNSWSLYHTHNDFRSWFKHFIKSIGKQGVLIYIV